MGIGRTEKCAQGATEYIIILAAVLVVAAVAVYYVSKPPSFPPLSAVPANVGNEIRINVGTGSISTGDWQYSVSTTEGNYDWTDGTVKLDAPYVTIENDKTADTYYVSLKHKPSGHIYFADRTVTIEWSF